MNYPLSKKYETDTIMSKIMGPNPVKLCEELLTGCKISRGAVICDLGSGEGVTSVFMAKEYGFKVYACDLWSEPESHIEFFTEMGLTEKEIVPVKADAENMPFEQMFFDGVVSIDSYNYFGRDKDFLDNKLLPFVKSGGYIYIAIPGMKKDCHDNLPPELLLSWNAEQMAYMRDINYWKDLVGKSQLAELIDIYQMESMDEVWEDWLKQENEYAIGDRKSMRNGADKYLNFIAIVLRKK